MLGFWGSGGSLGINQIEDTFAYSKRFNRNDFCRCCLVVDVSGNGPVKLFSNVSGSGNIHFSKNGY
jgi:hypothetical protein